MSEFWNDRTNLAGKTALVIGGGGGIGHAISLALSMAGVDLLISDIDGAALEQTVGDLEAQGKRVVGQRSDASDPAALDAFFDWACEQTEAIDILVNVVGGTFRRGLEQGNASLDASDIQRNYGYVIQSVRRALPLLRKSGKGGSIINFTTIEAHRGAAGFAVYAGAKAATANFTRAMAVELAADRIRLNCLAPDTTPSKGNAMALSPEIGAEMGKLPLEAQAKGIEMYIPMKQPPPVDAIADGVLFLASDLSAFITGQTLHVDGGTWAASGFLDWPFGDGYLPVPLAGTLSKLYTNED